MHECSQNAVDRKRSVVIQRACEKQYAPHQSAEIYAASLSSRNLEVEELLAPLSTLN
jgi:hypothetical protein